MSKRVEVFDDSWSIGRGFSRINRQTYGDVYWLDGLVVLPECVVDVYSDTDMSNYRIIRAGREYSRTERRSRNKIGLAIMARKFAADVLGTNGDTE